jgi:hypothetical protein
MSIAELILVSGRDADLVRLEGSSGAFGILGHPWERKLSVFGEHPLWRSPPETAACSPARSAVTARP